MLRRIFGLALLAVVAWLALNVVFGIAGTVIGLAITVLWLAAVGFFIYLLLRVFSPRTADRVREIIRARHGKPA